MCHKLFFFNFARLLLINYSYITLRTKNVVGIVLQHSTVEPCVHVQGLGVERSVPAALVLDVVGRVVGIETNCDASSSVSQLTGAVVIP